MKAPEAGPDAGSWTLANDHTGGLPAGPGHARNACLRTSFNLLRSKTDDTLAWRTFRCSRLSVASLGAAGVSHDLVPAAYPEPEGLPHARPVLYSSIMT